MTTTTYPTYGNLALKPTSDAPRFTVVAGGASAGVAAPQAPRRLPLFVGVSVVVALAAALFAIVVADGLSAQARLNDALYTTARETVSVGAGDSLWSIAEEHPIAGMSTDETVHVIKAWNDLDVSLLQPGMSLSVPER